jgi:two-component system response regulator AtoC
VLDQAEQVRHRRPSALPLTRTAEEATASFIGTSRVMTEICRSIGLAARSGVTTLIEGESGVGKELAARAIHALGGLARPFATVDCSTIVETLFESELFGHERGAFTGAYAARKGKVEAAQGGVLFLDEITELTHRMQAKLLRLLQTRTFERVGGASPIHVDFQLVAATNRALEPLVRNGSFRADLHYRLNVHRIVIPPLRERREDIPALVAYFTQQSCERLRTSSVAVTPEALDALVAYDWPGNVRELENVVTRLVLTSGGRAIDRIVVQRAIGTAAVRVPRGTLAQVERDAVVAALEATSWNLGRACSVLGISRPTLRRKMRRYDLRQPHG